MLTLLCTVQLHLNKKSLVKLRKHFRVARTADGKQEQRWYVTNGWLGVPPGKKQCCCDPQEQHIRSIAAIADNFIKSYTSVFKLAQSTAGQRNRRRDNHALVHVILVALKSVILYALTIQHWIERLADWPGQTDACMASETVLKGNIIC